MRSEKEMMDLILGIAREDDRIRAVYMNGSRTNPNVKKDIFQDYDIMYVVTENKPFYEDKTWIDRFGERLYMQCPEELDVMLGKEADFDKSYGWLIQFKDGNRLDLHVEPLEVTDVLDDKLCVILLDKDGILPKIPESTDEDYFVKKPAEGEYTAVCNEFWWCMNNIAKGMWRGEIPYVQNMYHSAVHPQLVKLLNWKIGYETDFKVSTGKASKYMYRWLPEEMWDRFLHTYFGWKTEEIWEAVFTACDLFLEVSKEVAEKYGYAFQEEEALGSYGFLKHVHNLPKDATEIYPGVK